MSAIPLVNLSDNYERIGQSEKAVRFAREGLHLEPGRAILHENLAESLQSLNRFSESKKACVAAIDAGIDAEVLHVLLYNIAFIDNDPAAMREHLAWFGGRPDEHIALDRQAGTAAFCGQRRKSQDFARRSVDLATRTGAAEIASNYAAEHALRIVFWSSGTGIPANDDEKLKPALQSQIRKALQLSRNQTTLARSAIAYAMAGNIKEADDLIREISDEYPKHTLLNQLWLPCARAAMKLQLGQFDEAVTELEIAERFEKAGDFFPQYIRGLAYFGAKKKNPAAKEFDKILNHRGEAPLSAIYPLAQLGKARAVKNKKEYEKFFEMWKDADEDMSALIAARHEFDKL